MKKRILLLVVCAFSTVAFAQKKGKVAEQNEREKDAISYIVMRAIEMPNMEVMAEFEGKEFQSNPEFQMKMASQMLQETYFQFSVMNAENSVSREIENDVSRASDLTAALSVIGRLGYEVEAAYALDKNGLTVHYYTLAKENEK